MVSHYQWLSMSLLICIVMISEKCRESTPCVLCKEIVPFLLSDQEQIVILGCVIQAKCTSVFILRNGIYFKGLPNHRVQFNCY